MPQTLALLHTTASLSPLFNSLCARHMANVRLLHFLDESLIKNTIAADRLERPTMRRVINLVGSAFDAGADCVLVTCSSIGPAVDIAATLYDQPVIRVDSAMAEEAVAKGRRVGVLATLSTTLAPTADLVRRKAAETDRDVEVVEHLCEGAYEAMMSGDTATHDRIIAGAVRKAMRSVEAIVFAQASMARAMDSLTADEIPAPVFTSPELGVQRARDVLAGKVV